MITTDPNVSTKFDPGFDAWIDPALLSAYIADALKSLNQLSKTRADDNDQWLQVGMALRSLGKDGLELWDGWSKQSLKYQPDICAHKWITFTSARINAEGIAFDNLLEWARQDNRVPFVRPCPRNAKPSDYERAISQLGYKPALNEMNNEIFIRGVRLEDPLEAKIVNSLAEHGYKSEGISKRCILAMGFDNQFHPIRDYLNSVAWDGVDHIGKLASYFQDKDDVFPVLLRKWLIGAVARVLKPNDGIQNPMLVLDGPQNIGKSYLAWWLGSPLPAYFLDGPITPGDKDDRIRACSSFVWEVSELGATTRRADIEALKAFIYMRFATVRVPYGHRDMKKPPTASFIGTINNVGGFLADPTGNRRFNTCTLTAIDWNYSNEVNINKVWAQAVALFLSGETNELDSTIKTKVSEINERYELDDPLAYVIFDKFNVEPKADVKTYAHKQIATAKIIEELRTSGYIVGSNDKQLAMQIASILVKIGCNKTTIIVNGQKVRGWGGIWK